MFVPLLATAAVATVTVGLVLVAGVGGVAHLAFGALADSHGHDDPERRRRGHWSFDAGVVLSVVGFVGTLALFVVADALAAATGLGHGTLLYLGIGALVVGSLVMVVGVGLAFEADG